MDSKPELFRYSSNCSLYFRSSAVSSSICAEDSRQMVAADTRMQKVVQRASFWLRGLGRLERSQSLQRQTAEKSFQATFLLVFTETSQQCSVSRGSVSFLWLRQRKGLFIILQHHPNLQAIVRIR